MARIETEPGTVATAALIHADPPGVVYTCLVCHYNDDGTPAPPCHRCAHCAEWVRPEQLGQPCPGRAAP